jgi:ERF superfamily
MSGIVAALAAARVKFPKILKTRTATVPTKTGGSYTYHYADLSDLVDAVMGPLGDQGLVVTQRMEISEGGGTLLLVTELLHVSGENLRSVYPLPDPGTQRPQEFGSALTYSRRYALSALLGVAAEEDDDAQAAQAAPPRAAAARKAPAKAEPVERTVVAVAQPPADAEFYFAPEEPAPPEPQWRTWRTDPVSKNAKSAMAARTWGEMLEGSHGGERYQWLRFLLSRDDVNPKVRERALYALYHLEKNERERRAAMAARGTSAADSVF